MFLDTYPYNGHTTAGDALRAGLPVVSLCGGSFASRVALSLLNDIGIPDMACTQLNEYKDLALELAKFPSKREIIVSLLNKNIKNKEWPPTDVVQANSLMKIIECIN